MGKIDVAEMFARVWIKRSIKSFSAALSSLLPAPEEGRPCVVVLMYHRVNSYRRNELSVRPDDFRRQLDWLRDRGFENMRMAELEARSHGGRADRPRVVFTFDDGYEDNCLVAAPILKERGYTAVFYVAVDCVSSAVMDRRDARESGRMEHNRWMTWDELKELLAQGMEIGSHGMSHARLRSLPPDEALREIGDSKRALEERLSMPVTSFSYPGGLYRAEHVAMVEQAGYLSACTASPGNVGENLFEIPRTAVQASDTFFVFARKLEGRLNWLRAVR